jgi:hypothetical protein
MRLPEAVQWTRRQEFNEWGGRKWEPEKSPDLDNSVV